MGLLFFIKQYLYGVLKEGLIEKSTKAFQQFLYLIHFSRNVCFHLISLYYTSFNLQTSMFDLFTCVNYMGLLPTSSETLSITSSEIYLLRKIVTCLILILPTVYIYIYRERVSRQVVYLQAGLNSDKAGAVSLRCLAACGQQCGYCHPQL